VSEIIHGYEVPAGHPKEQMTKVWVRSPSHGEFFRALSKIFDDVVKLLKGLEVWLAGHGDGWHILLMVHKSKDHQWRW